MHTFGKVRRVLALRLITTYSPKIGFSYETSLYQYRYGTRQFQVEIKSFPFIAHVSRITRGHPHTYTS